MHRVSQIWNLSLLESRNFICWRTLTLIFVVREVLQLGGGKVRRNEQEQHVWPASLTTSQRTPQLRMQDIKFVWTWHVFLQNFTNFQMHGFALSKKKDSDTIWQGLSQKLPKVHPLVAMKLVRLRSRTHTSWIISCLRQIFCVESVHLIVYETVVGIWHTTPSMLHCLAPRISRVSCKKGPTRHAYAWQIGPFWQDTLDLNLHFSLSGDLMVHYEAKVMPSFAVGSHVLRCASCPYLTCVILCAFVLWLYIR